ncbi:MAG: energy transducer TonB [Chitinophagales bacterium]
MRFVEMVAVEDEQVADDDEPIQIDNIKDDISNVTQEGDDDAEVQILSEPVVVDEPVVESKKVYEFLEQMPEYPGGVKKLYEYIANHIEYPRMARDNGVEGTVYLKFIVDETGAVSDVQLLRGIGAGCDEEAMRVIRGMPKWTPGKQNGKPAAVWYKLPVKFTLSD